MLSWYRSVCFFTLRSSTGERHATGEHDPELCGELPLRSDDSRWLYLAIMSRMFGDSSFAGAFFCISSRRWVLGDCGSGGRFVTSFCSGGCSLLEDSISLLTTTGLTDVSPSTVVKILRFVRTRTFAVQLMELELPCWLSSSSTWVSVGEIRISSVTLTEQDGSGGFSGCPSSFLIFSTYTTSSAFSACGVCGIFSVESVGFFARLVLRFVFLGTSRT
uniref:(northern house mosquito) hypothetical protein n=1 Tax=Culex pipiens TaxID=7175 RepID=A0A8D8CM13_CULPI